MDIRTLRYALTLADELHFGRAAQAHFIAPQQFGRRIQELEKELDAALFQRTTRRVSLTEAGEKFLPRARRALAEVDALMDAAEGDPAEPALRVGMLGYGLADRWRSVRETLARSHPQVVLSYVDLTWENQYDAVRTGEVDVAIVHDVGGADDLTIDEVVASSRYAVVPADSELAGAPRLTMADIADLPSVTPIGQPGLLDWVIGRSPTFGARVRTPVSIPSAVAATGCIAIHAEPARRYLTHPGVQYVPMDGPPAIMAVASRTRDRRDLVAAFRASVQASTELDGLQI